MIRKQLSGDDADSKEQASGLLQDLGWTEDSIVNLVGEVRVPRPLTGRAMMFFRPKPPCSEKVREGSLQK